MRIKYTKEGKIRDGDYIYQEGERDKGMGLHLPRRMNKGLGSLPNRERQGNEIESTKRDNDSFVMYLMTYVLAIPVSLYFYILNFLVLFLLSHHFLFVPLVFGGC